MSRGHELRLVKKWICAQWCQIQWSSSTPCLGPRWKAMTTRHRYRPGEIPVTALIDGTTLNTCREGEGKVKERKRDGKTIKWTCSKWSWIWVNRFYWAGLKNCTQYYGIVVDPSHVSPNYFLRHCITAWPASPHVKKWHTILKSSSRSSHLLYRYFEL